MGLRQTLLVLEELGDPSFLKDIGAWKKLKLRIFGYVYLRQEKRTGWKGYLPIYLVVCRKHGYYEDYPHGYNQRFNCPKCLEEKVKKANKE